MEAPQGVDGPVVILFIDITLTELAVGLGLEKAGYGVAGRLDIVGTLRDFVHYSPLPLGVWTRVCLVASIPVSCTTIST